MKKMITRISLLFLLFAHVKAYSNTISPTVPAANLKAMGTDGDKITVSWTNGDGSHRIVIARKDAPVTSVPVNGVNYAASGLFGAGNQPAPDEYVVYNGAGSSVTVSGLQPSSLYYFSVFEYNGTGAAIEYLFTAAAISGSTYSAPLSQPQNPVIDNIDGHSMRISWVNATGGDGNGRIVLVREGAPVNVNPVDLYNYSASLNFGTGSEIGSGNFVLYKSNGNNATVTNLEPGKTYYFALFEYKGSSGLVYNISSPPTAFATTLPRPSQPAISFSFSGVEGNSMTVSVNKGNGARRIIIARANAPVTFLPVDGASYTASAAFGSGDQVAPGEYIILSGTGTSVVLSNLQIGTTYYFAEFEYDGTGSGTAYLSSSFLTGSHSTPSAPTTAASQLQISQVTNSAFTATWQNGNGERRLVVVRRSDAVAGTPVNLTRYSASSSFQYGSNVGPNNYAVYANTGNSVTVTGLVGGYSYIVSVYEYNGSNAPVYLLNPYASTTVTTALSPSQPASATQFTGIEGNRFSVSWQNGNGNRRMVIARAGSPVTARPQDNASYTAGGLFGQGEEIAPGEFVVYNNASPSFVMANLQPGTTYYLAVFEYNTVSGVNYYLTSTFASGSQSTVSRPQQAATGLSFSSVTGNRLQLNWTRGDGANRLVIAREGSAVTNLPADFSAYTANTQFGLGSQVGAGNYVVYNGNGNSSTVTGLNPGRNYYFAIVEYNGANYPVYGTSALTGSQATHEGPQQPATALNFAQWEGNKVTVKWISGDGAGRIIIARQGAPVTASPVNGNVYTANAAFGLGEEIAPGEFVIYDNSFSEMPLTNLVPGSTYYFAVYEYDGSGSDRRYLQSPFLSGSGTTLVAPTQQASNVLFSSIGSNSVSVNWTAGNADRYLLVARKGAPVNATPQDLLMYASSYQYGKSVFQGDMFTLYSNAGTNASITGLTPGTTYYFSVFGYNGFSGPVYNILSPATGQVTTIGPPTDAASNIVFHSTGNSQSVRINWTNGSGQQRLVLVKEAAPVDALPQNNQGYSGNSFFGGGDELGNGNFVVYSGASNQVTINNLKPATNYYVSVFEFNQFSGGPLYLTSTAPTAVFSGFALPLTLGSFTGEAKGMENRLAWSTVSESNTRQFVIERSSGSGDFQQLAAVPAAGNSSVTRWYHFTDSAPAGISMYRLKMEDLDGRFTYSYVITLKRNTADSVRVRLFPTLAEQSVTLQLHQPAAFAGSWQIAGADGKIYRKGRLEGGPGDTTLRIPLDGLARGMYTLQWVGKGPIVTQRFIKQ